MNQKQKDELKRILINEGVPYAFIKDVTVSIGNVFELDEKKIENRKIEVIPNGIVVPGDSRILTALKSPEPKGCGPGEPGAL